MDLVELVADQFGAAMSDGKARVRLCADRGISCEGWLKVELLHRLVTAVAQERVFVTPEEGNVDLTLRGGGQEVLLELKSFPTNYGRSGKPITNFIDGVVRDLEKLASKRLEGQVGLALWLAYFVPDPAPGTWPSHMAKVEAAALRTVRAQKIPLGDGKFAAGYLMQSN